MNNEQKRLSDITQNWCKWGPYISDRQWGTVREDYSSNGEAWDYITHDMARSKAFRWGEEGIGGISDNKQQICFAWSFWNHADSILKERFFGLTGKESNHGEDVKELYYYLDNTPSHSYQKMLYKYPQAAFPYQELRDVSKSIGKFDPEFELIDTGIFNENKYFDIFIEYAKAATEDILIKLTVKNQNNQTSNITVLPTIWFRNRWSWGYDSTKPILTGISNNHIEASHKILGEYQLYAEGSKQLLFCENETNNQTLYGSENATHSCKDGIDDYVVNGNKNAINHTQTGTKASAFYELTLDGSETQVIRLRLCNQFNNNPFEDFDDIFKARQNEADEFYYNLIKDKPKLLTDKDSMSIIRQAFAGMLWSKQFFHYDVNRWLKGDPAQLRPPLEHQKGRNSSWRHFHTTDIISMPDKWEYPWFAAWDLAFHTVVLASVDINFAKNQIELLLKTRTLHPNGQIPAYEWNFSDVNPPVHAWAAWKIYQIEQKNGTGDIDFLERVFQKLLLNFTWWVNQKDEGGNNIFEGGFLGLDNIGVFDRSAALPTGGHIEQADGTSWMAMYSLNMLRIACELSIKNSQYQEFARKFFEHFLYIAGALHDIGGENENLWNEEDQFYYDMLRLPNGRGISLKVRSMVGLIPLYAVEVLTPELLDKLPKFKIHVEEFLADRPDLALLVSHWNIEGQNDIKLLSLLRGHRLKMLLKRMLDPNEFLSDYGIRALSKFHENNPYEIEVHGQQFSVQYNPAESDNSMFGGNSNWRGPIWMPVNYLIVDSLLKFYEYFGDDFKIEYPTNSGQMLNLKEISDSLKERLISIFKLNNQNKRPLWGNYEKFQTDPLFRDNLFFYEYFHGDTGAGLGASHQTGWTGLVADLLF